MRRISIIAAMGMFLLTNIMAASQFQGSPSAIGTVNLNDMLQQKQFLAKQEAINEKYKPLAEELKKTAETLQKDIQKFNEEKSKLAAKDAEKQAKDLADRRDKFASKNTELMQKKMAEYQELSNEYLNAIRLATAEVAKKKGMSVVLSESDATMYASKQLDITQDVLKNVKF